MPESTSTHISSVVAESLPIGQTYIDEDRALRTAVENLSNEVALEGTHPRAVVLMPPEEQLQVKLVKLESVLRLQEANSDENIAAGAFWALTGALFGIGVNIITSDSASVSISKASWVAIGFTLIFLVATGLQWLRIAVRTREIKRQLGTDLTKG